MTDDTGYIAYSATVQMHEAKWTDKEGSTVTFKLPMEGMEGQRNPFEKWTKRRKGHAGTRFMMACKHVKGMVAVYADEVMLAGWNDSQNVGHTVKLWLCADNMGHPFEGFERHKDRFEVALVELDDDQEPIDQDMRDRVESRAKRPSERLSYVAAMLCKNEGFWTWCGESGYVLCGEPVVDEESAKLWVCMMCGIKSRAELDDPSNERAIQRFHGVRKDFLEWQGDG